MNPSGQLRSALPAVLLLAAGVAGLAAPQVLPADGDRVAIVAPGHDLLKIVADAGGLAFGASHTAIYATSTEPGFVDRLYHSGAWLVLRFDGVAGCLRAQFQETNYERS
jgi:hypothetical protein